ncbi:MAG: hypothetical protein ACI4MH_01295 [Candidatus Coproplasma sp.]
MSRIKHLISLIAKILIIVIAFAVSTVWTALSGCKTAQVRIGDNINESKIKITTKNGATVDYEIVDGNIVFDVSQGTDYDDVVVKIYTPPTTYDATLLEHFYGENTAPEFVEAMKAGPWIGNLEYALQGTSQDGSSMSFTILNPFGEKEIKTLNSEGSTKLYETDSFEVESGEEVPFKLTFGSETGGALPSGKYTLSGGIKITGLKDSEKDVKSLPFTERLTITAKIVGIALKDAGIKGIFSVTNLMLFIGFLYLVGMMIFFWKDLRSAYRIVKYCDDSSEIKKMIVSVFVNGQFVGSYERYEGGISPVGFILICPLIYLLLTVLIPVRLVIQSVCDIVCLVKHDETEQGVSLLGNFLGSMGLLGAAFSFVTFFSGAFALGGIVLGVAIVCMILSVLLEKRIVKKYGN